MLHRFEYYISFLVLPKKKKEEEPMNIFITKTGKRIIGSEKRLYVLLSQGNSSSLKIEPYTYITLNEHTE